jgi:hypothetical protein
MEKVSQALPCFHLMEVQRKLREKLGFSIQFSPEKSFAMVYHPAGSSARDLRVGGIGNCAHVETDRMETIVSMMGS